jgi:hypothetical protein
MASVVADFLKAKTPVEGSLHLGLHWVFTGCTPVSRLKATQAKMETMITKRIIFD